MGKDTFALVPFACSHRQQQPERSPPFFCPSPRSERHEYQSKASPAPADAMASSPLRTVHLRWSSLPAAAEAAIAVVGGGGVDLARVGRALGLDPATVRLNGYFLSRGPGHVSSTVTWRALLAFFAARGLPTGADPAAPIAVNGKPALSPPPSDPTIHMCSKQKAGLEAENCSKKNKLQENSSSLSKSVDELLSDDITIGLKRILRLDETSPAKNFTGISP